MSTNRLTRVNELLKRTLAEIIFRLLTTSEWDASAVTVSRVVTGSSLREAHVMISIRGYEDRRNRVLDFLRRERGRIQKEMSRQVILKYTPILTFELDTSIEEGDRVLGLIAQMERAQEQAQERTGEQAGEPAGEQAKGQNDAGQHAQGT